MISKFGNQDGVYPVSVLRTDPDILGSRHGKWGSKRWKVNLETLTVVGGCRDPVVVKGTDFLPNRSLSPNFLSHTASS